MLLLCEYRHAALESASPPQPVPERHGWPMRAAPGAWICRVGGNYAARSMSSILESALESYQEMRDVFELYRHAAILRASCELHGELLNIHGRAHRLDPYSPVRG